MQSESYDALANVIAMSKMIVAAIDDPSSMTSLQRIQLIFARDKALLYLSQRDMYLFRLWVDSQCN